MRNSIRDIDIQELIEENERLVQIAVVNSEEGEVQSVNEITNFLISVFDLIYEYKKTNPDRYEYLIFRSIPFQGELRQLYESKEDYYNQISFIGAFREGLFRIWKQGYLTNQYPICQSLIFKIQKIIARLSVDPDNRIAINEYLYLLSQILSFGIRSNGNVRYEFLVGPAYYVYFNIVLDSTNIPIRIEYLRNINEYLWNSLREIVNTNCKSIFKSFVSTLFLSQYTSLITIRRAYEYFDYNSSHLKMLAKLDQDILFVNSLKNLENTLSTINEIVDVYGSDISRDFTKEQVKEKLKENAHRSYRINNLRIYIYLLGTFLVFKKKYTWIEILWNYHQPNDADATFGSNNILPEDLSSVFHYLLKVDEYRVRIEFAWAENHGSSIYYYRYGLLLLGRLPFVTILYGYQDPLNILNLINSVQSNYYDRLIDICKDLLKHTKIIEDVRFFPKHIKKGDEEILMRESVDRLLNEIVIKTEEVKAQVIKRQRISQKEFHQLLENVSENFEKENQLVDILRLNGCIEILKNDNDKFKELKHIVNRPKAEFNEQWRNLGAAMGYEVSRNMSYRLCSIFVSELSKMSVQVDLRKFAFTSFEAIISALETNIGPFIEPMIIGFGFNFHHLLWKDINFQFESDNSNKIKVGEYLVNNRKIKVYNVANWARLNYIFVIDIKQFGKMKLIKYDKAENLRGYISGKMNDEQDKMVLRFEYSALFKIEFVEEPRILKVVLND